MARAHRVALMLAIVATSYLLCLFGVLSVPLVDPKVSEQILPVVRPISLHLKDVVLLELHPTLSATYRFLPIRNLQIFAGSTLCLPFGEISSHGGC